MKKILFQTAIALSILFTLTTTASASTGNNTPAAEMKAIGSINNQPVYELSINNNTYARYTIIVSDEFGVVLHEETITGINISRKYQINTFELGKTGVRFEVIASTQKADTFNIKNNVVAKEEDSTKGLKK